MGLDLGLERAGLEIALALECAAAPVATIKRNRPSLPLIDKPIEEVSSSELLTTIGHRKGDIFAVVGGPSCQGFSTMGRRRSLGDPRSSSLYHFIRVVSETAPEYFVMENVRGLISAAIRHRPLSQRGIGYPPLSEEEELGSAFRVVLSKLKMLGYYCVFGIMNCADYGVPQIRHRLVIIGSRDGRRIRAPQPTHSRTESNGMAKWRTLSDAFDGLVDKEPEFCSFCSSTMDYLKFVPEGGNWRSLPDRVKHDAMRTALSSQGGRSGYFRRLSFSMPSPTLTTSPDNKATLLCHPKEPRPLTVAEYARIQQFPDDWDFEGSVRKKYEQIGNAVPLGLGEILGITLLNANDQNRKSDLLGVIDTMSVDLYCKLPDKTKQLLGSDG